MRCLGFGGVHLFFLRFVKMFTRHYCPKLNLAFYRWLDLNEGAWMRVYYPSGDAELRAHALRTAKLAHAGCGPARLELEVHEGCRSVLCRHDAEPAPPRSPAPEDSAPFAEVETPTPTGGKGKGAADE